MSLLGILIAILVICVLVWAARALMAAFNVGEPFRTVILVVLVILCLIMFLNVVGVESPINLR